MTQQGPEPQQNDVMKDILERAGLEDINDVPAGSEYNWASLGVWRAEMPIPLAGYEFLMIFGLFQTDKEVRVYAVPKTEPLKDKDGNFIHEPVPHRFTLSKTGKPYFIEIIRNPEVFKDEIAVELAKLRAVTLDVLAGVDAAEMLDAARELIAEGRIDEAVDLLREDEEEEDEPSPPPVRVQKQAAPPV